MKSGLRAVLHVAGLVLCLALVATVQAQTRDKYVISAKAGVVNLSSGDVTVRREGIKGERRLTSKDDLESGDIVSTGVGGRMEMLLNPGSYMRVDENSEFELTDASLDSLLVNLRKGSAVVEVTDADDVKVTISIETPQTSAMITRGGIYRFNVLPGQITEIFVRKGRLLYGKNTENQLKGGQKLLIRQGREEVAKFDKNEQDQLDQWSKDRAKTLARANSQLQARNLYTALNGHSLWDTYGSYGYRSGVWIFDASVGFCFLPFGGRSWSSPYGYGYSTRLWFTNGYNGNPGYPSGGATVSGGTPIGNQGGNPGGNQGGNPGGNPPPNYQPPPSSPPPTISGPPTMSQPPSQPMNEPTIERGPRRDYTTNSPN